MLASPGLERVLGGALGHEGVRDRGGVLCAESDLPRSSDQRLLRCSVVDIRVARGGYTEAYIATFHATVGIVGIHAMYQGAIVRSFHVHTMYRHLVSICVGSDRCQGVDRYGTRRSRYTGRGGSGFAFGDRSARFLYRSRLCFCVLVLSTLVLQRLVSTCGDTDSDIRSVGRGRGDLEVGRLAPVAEWYSDSTGLRDLAFTMKKQENYDKSRRMRWSSRKRYVFQFRRRRQDGTT